MNSIEVGMTPEMMYTESEDGEPCFNVENVNALGRLFYMKRQEVLNLRSMCHGWR